MEKKDEPLDKPIEIDELDDAALDAVAGGVNQNGCTNNGDCSAETNVQNCVNNRTCPAQLE